MKLHHLAAFLLAGTSLYGQRALDRAADALFFSSDDGVYQAQFGVEGILTGFYADDNGPPGFFFSGDGDDFELSPRLTLLGDFFAGERLYGFLKLRADDGVHPGLQDAAGGDYSNTLRVDELYLRLAILDERLALQAGRYTPPFGNFLGRHTEWDNPFLTYPLAYQQITSVGDVPIPATPDQFADRAGAPDKKLIWVSPVWAPLYTQGATVLGSAEKWEYALSVANRAPSSRGSTWDDFTWEESTWLGRLVYSPEAAWRFGVSGSIGPYLQEKVPVETDDFYQYNAGFDVTWAHRDLEVWAELMLTRFEVPNVGDAELISYYIEARYNLTMDWSASLRWNQMFFDKISTSTGERRWDQNTDRIDAAVTWKLNRHWRATAQYSYTDHGSVDIGEHFAGLRLVLKL